MCGTNWVENNDVEQQTKHEFRLKMRARDADTKNCQLNKEASDINFAKVLTFVAE